MKRFNILILLIFFALIPFSQEVFSEEKRVNEILNKMTDAELKSSYQGERFIFNFYSPKPNIIRYEVIHIRPGLEKKVLKSLDNKDRLIILKDGKNLWEYIPSQNRVIKRTVDPIEDKTNALVKNIDLVRKNYSIKVIEDDVEIFNRKSTLIEFVPREGQKRARYKIWIDKERGIALRTETYSPDNKLTFLSFYSRIDFTPPRDRGKFVLMVPKNTSLQSVKEGGNLKVINLQSLVDFEVKLPKSLPKGFILSGGRVKTFKNTKELHIHYSDGLSGVSLFENSSGRMYTRKRTPVRTVDIRGNEGNFYHVGPVRILEWQAYGLTLALVGELEEEEFIKIARSIE